MVLSGQYNVGNEVIELRDPGRGNRKVTAGLWYPVVSEGQPVVKGNVRSDKFPVICFAHGYLHPGDQYGNLVDILVPAGYIIISLTTCEGPVPSHRGYVDEIRFLAGAVKGLGSDTHSPLYGIADTLVCLMGHSMGGGASFIAAAANTNVDALVALTPWEIRPSAIEAAGSVTVPTLIFSGTSDCITPPEKNHMPMYQRSAAEDKTYISIINGSHCGMGDSHKCFTAERLSGCKNGLSTEVQTVILERYLIPWLNCILKGDREEGLVFNCTLASDHAVTWLRSRALPEPD